MRFLFKTDYQQDIRLFKHSGQAFWYAALGLSLLAAPWLLPDYWVSQLNFIWIYSIVSLGLMILVGFTGQVSIGHAAFLAMGAYTEAFLQGHGWPFVLSLPFSALVAGLTGVIVGLPALRVKGMYLAIATMAFGFIVEEGIARAESITGGNAGRMLGSLEVFGIAIDSELRMYFLTLSVLALVVVGVMNLLRSPTGRAFVAIRDSEVSAQSMGIHLAAYKTLSFAISAAMAGLGGALYAHMIKFLSPDQFNIIQSIDLLLMVVIGGLGSVHGAFLGAIFLIVLPQVISAVKDVLPAFIGQAPGLKAVVYGAVLIAFVLFEPMGLYGRWLKIRTYFSIFPFYRRGMFKRQKAFQKSDRLR